MSWLGELVLNTTCPAYVFTIINNYKGVLHVHIFIYAPPFAPWMRVGYTVFGSSPNWKALATLGCTVSELPSYHTFQMSGLGMRGLWWCWTWSETDIPQWRHSYWLYVGICQVCCAENVGSVWNSLSNSLVKLLTQRTFISATLWMFGRLLSLHGTAGCSPCLWVWPFGIAINMFAFTPCPVHRDYHITSNSLSTLNPWNIYLFYVM